MKFIKKASITFTVLLILINILGYIGSYNFYVTKSPQQYKEARKEIAKANLFSLYETFTLKLGLLSHQNILLSPFQYLTKYYYEEALKKYPQNDSEKAVWYSRIILFPLLLETKNFNHGSIATHYGIDYTQKLITNLYDNMYLLSNKQIVDYDNLNQYFLTFSFIESYSIYTYNFHLLDKTTAYSGAIKKALDDNQKINKLWNVFKMRIKYFNNPLYKKHIEKFYSSRIIKGKPNTGKLYIAKIDYYLTSAILQNVLKVNKKTLNDSEIEVLYYRNKSLNFLKNYYKNTPSKSDYTESIINNNVWFFDRVNKLNEKINNGRI